MREQEKDESRKDYMLKVAATYIELHCNYEAIRYDDAECDGLCVIDDCLNAIECED